MARPFPVMPRGPRRKRRAPARHMIACPRVSPEWELAALRALMKPQTGAAIAHRSGDQRWPANAAEVVESIRRGLGERLGFEPKVHLPDAGEFHLLIEVDVDELLPAMAFATVLSSRLPELWFTLDRLFFKDGRVYRRERGVKLNLVPATNVHLPRAVRSAIRPVLR